MIHELLTAGRTNAKTGKELAAVCSCDIRDITEQIEKERRAGIPICATSSRDNAGYYLAETPEELQSYCNRLHHRAAELYKTRQALLAVLRQLPGVTTDTGSNKTTTEGANNEAATSTDNSDQHR